MLGSHLSAGCLLTASARLWVNIGIRKILKGDLYMDGVDTFGRRGQLGKAASDKMLSQQLKSHNKQLLELWTSLPDSFRPVKTKQMSQLQTSSSAKCNVG